MSTSISRILELWERTRALRRMNKAVKSVTRSLEAFERAAGGQGVKSDDPVLLKADAVGSALLADIHDLEQLTDNDWVIASGYDSLANLREADGSTARDALRFIHTQRAELLAIADATEGIILLLRAHQVVKRASALRSLQYMFVPSLHAIEEIHRADVITNLRAAEARSRSLEARLGRIEARLNEAFRRESKVRLR